MRPAVVFIVAWATWGLTWFLAAPWTGRTIRRASRSGAVVHRLLVVAGAILLLHHTSKRLGATMLWHVGKDGAYALAIVAIAGFLFTWWARLHLGRLWSASVTRKEGHRVVDTGPYALVRHPIYAGLILATLATAVAEATVPALAGAALIAAGLWVKAGTEERFLRTELGADAYGAYRRRVPMLIPLWPTGG